MKKDLQALCGLQHIDTEIITREARIKNIPLEIEKLSKDLLVKEEDFKKKEADLQKFTTKTRQLEQSIEDAKDKITKYKSQLLQIKTNKEYQAILQEISTEQAKISAYEEEILETLAQNETLTKEFQGLRNQMENNKKDTQLSQQELNKELETVKQELSVKIKERVELTKSISKSLFVKYEHIKQGRHGIGIAEISGSTCKGCNALLPPQVIAEVQKGEKIWVCDSCGRILIWHDE
ncbi:MAG: C4-type zinc ribbon domain-containing protein [bacterium]|nr:C4-type zinc ribbon domain-containing protein [bacterium]